MPFPCWFSVREAEAIRSLWKIGLPALVLGEAAASAATPREVPFYLGANMSFANEMQDCGATFRHKGKPVDPIEPLPRRGGNVVRLLIIDNGSAAPGGEGTSIGWRGSMR